MSLFIRYDLLKIQFKDQGNNLKELTFRDAIPFIERIPDHKKLTLVGGQAICFWYEYYAEKYGNLFDENMLITTQDIDFLGHQDTVRECAEAWHGRHELTSIDDHSPNSGIVIIDYDGDELRIDFLWQVQGMDKSEVEKERLEILLPVGQHEPLHFYILSPFLCLVSRAANVLTLNRTDKHSLDQLKTAIVIVKCFINESLNSNQEDMARNIAENVFKLAISKSEGIRLFTEFDIDIFGAIPKDNRFNKNFLKHRYPRMLDELNTKRKVQTKHLGKKKH